MTSEPLEPEEFLQFMERVSEEFPEQVTGSQLSSLIATILYNTVSDDVQDVYPIVLRAVELFMMAHADEFDEDSAFFEASDKPVIH